jgi:Zn-dependent protease
MDLPSILTTIAIAAIPVVFAITVHEVAHGWVAKQFGDRTAEMLGRLTLNPVRHVDPVGTVLVPGILLLSGSGFLFGWAKPVPVDPRNLRNPRRNMVLVTAAGPMANLVMATIWAIIMMVGQDSVGGVGGEWITRMAQYGVLFNIMLAVFNMLPIPPLDGGQVLTNLLPQGAVTDFLRRFAPFGLFVVLALIISKQLWPLIGPPFGFLLSVLVNVFGLRLLPF